MVTNGGSASFTGSSVAVANMSTNSAVVAQSPKITVIASIPIVVMQPNGKVTINAVIAGVVRTTIIGTGLNTSNGSAQLTEGGAGSAIVTVIGNASSNTVIILQTPTITVIFEIPITIIDPQGAVDVHATIAGIVQTELKAIAANTSDGTTITSGGTGTTVASPDQSTNAIQIVQAPTISLQQNIPITIVNPSDAVSIDALIGSTVTTTLDATAVNTSSGTIGVGSAPQVSASGGGGTVQVIQAPAVEVASTIPVTITDPQGATTVHAMVADIVRTVVQQTIGATTPPVDHGGSGGAIAGGNEGTQGLFTPPIPVGTLLHPPTFGDVTGGSVRAAATFRFGLPPRHRSPTARRSTWRRTTPRVPRFTGDHTTASASGAHPSPAMTPVSAARPWWNPGSPIAPLVGLGISVTAAELIRRRRRTN